jgi:hypothetical protein
MLQSIKIYCSFRLFPTFYLIWNHNIWQWADTVEYLNYKAKKINNFIIHDSKHVAHEWQIENSLSRAFLKKKKAEKFFWQQTSLFTKIMQRDNLTSLGEYQISTANSLMIWARVLTFFRCRGDSFGAKTAIENFVSQQSTKFGMCLLQRSFDNTTKFVHWSKLLRIFKKFI